jgi:hypothetical protein
MSRSIDQDRSLDPLASVPDGLVPRYWARNLKDCSDEGNV